MPLPTTDEALITGPIVEAIDALKGVMDSVLIQITLIRENGDRGRLPLAAVLVQEFLAQQDLDGGKGTGGSVYGLDFMIGVGLPPMLAAIHDHPNWSAPSTVLTWSDYLLSGT